MSNLVRRIILAVTLIAGLVPVIAAPPPAVPALPDAERRTTYTLTNQTCACAVGFALYGDSTDYQNWVEVWLNGKLVQYNDPAYGWTLTSPTGSIGNIPRPITDAVLTFNIPQTGTVQIVGARRPRRVAQFSENRGVAARDLNVALTDLVAQNREEWDRTNDVIGRTVRVPPGETMSVLPPMASRENLGACFDNSGNLTVCASVPSTTFSAGIGISFSGTNPTTITNNIQGSLPIVITGTNPLSITCPNCVAGSNVAFVAASRAAAAAQNLSAYSVVKTLGYATAGDGGGATFKKLASGNFQDAYITGATLAGGSSYTNGTYLGVPLTGGTGAGCEGSVTVSGGAVTSVSIVIPCAGYAVGDVLSTSNSFIGGTGSGFTWTVTSISAPQASFTDAASNKWQFIADQPGRANLLQFGAKGDWNGSDAGATNNSGALWSASAWASYPIGASAAQVYGNQIIIPRGAYMTCGAFNSSIYDIPIPQGVRFTGAGVGGTTLIECATDTNANHYIELCDSNAKVGQYGCKVEDMTIVTSQVTGQTANIAAIYSNSGQQFPLAERIEIQPGNRTCIFYEIGKGGAANAIFDHIDCEQVNTVTNDGMRFNSTGTLITLRDSVFGAGGGTATHNAIDLLGGRLIADGIEIEEATTGINVATTVASDLSAIRNVNITNGCVNGIVLNASNPNNTVLVENVNGNSCSANLVSNGHTGGASVAAGSILAQKFFNP
jgi:hypothetical protein